MAIIRKAKANDLKLIHRIEEELFSPPFTFEDLKRELYKNTHSQIYILEEQDSILGYSIMWILFEHAQIVKIGVTKTKQSNGFGKMLMNKMIEDAKEKGCEIMSLEVRVSNIQAYNFYEFFDFKKATIRKAYYKNPTEDGYLLWRMLS